MSHVVQSSVMGTLEKIWGDGSEAEGGSPPFSWLRLNCIFSVNLRRKAVMEESGCVGYNQAHSPRSQSLNRARWCFESEHKACSTDTVPLRVLGKEPWLCS